MSASDPTTFIHDLKTSEQAQKETKEVTKRELDKLQAHIKKQGPRVYNHNSSNSSLSSINEKDEGDISTEESDDDSVEHIVKTQKTIHHVRQTDSSALLNLIANLQLSARKDMNKKVDLLNKLEKSDSNGRLLKY